MDTIPCNRLYTTSPLDRTYVASRLGLEEYILSERLHLVKNRAGLRGRPVWICLDDGEVYDPQSHESLGNVFYV